MIQLNHFERVAGAFVLLAIGGTCAMVVAVAQQKGWFEHKINFRTALASADGIRVGTQVVMAGLRAGSVENVELGQSSEVLVELKVSQKFAGRVRSDSKLHVVRPFVIGEKVIEISLGTEDAQVLSEGALITSESSFDPMDLMNGRLLGPYLNTLMGSLGQLKELADQLSANGRPQKIVKMFDQMPVLLNNSVLLTQSTNSMLSQVNKKHEIENIVSGLAEVSQVLKEVLPHVREDAPAVASDVEKIARNMAVLTEEMQKALPVLQEMAPEFPRASKRALEALDETVVTLKALQKSFLLRGSVREVREAEKKEIQNPSREPADAK